MSFEILEKTVEDGTLSLKVEVAKSVVDEAYRNVRKQLSRWVKIPGFRKGKTPLGVLANHIGKERFQQEIERELLPSYYYKAVEASGFRPTSGVSYEEKNLIKGKPFGFLAKVAVAPEVKLGDYKAAEVDAPEAEEVDDEDLSVRMDEFLLRFAEFSDKEGKAEEGDIVSLSVAAKVDGVDFPSMSREQIRLKIGHDGYFPDFDAELKGLAKDEEKTFELTGPDEAANPRVKGKPVEFTVKILSIETASMPELDEEFFKKIGPGLEKKEDLEEIFRTELQREAQKKTDEAYDLVLQDKLLELVEVEPPASLLEERVEEKLAEFKEQFTDGYSFSDYLSEWDRSEEDLVAELRENATKALKVEFALDEIAAKESLEVSDEEVSQRLKIVARYLKRSPLDLEEMVDATGTRVVEKQKILREKAFGWFRSQQTDR